MSFNPHVTVAAVIERNGQYLMVKEHGEDKVVYNQPAGHLENNESLIEAAIREALEETGWRIRIKSLLGISRYIAPANGETYISFSFAAKAIELTQRTLDEGIIEALWLSKAQLQALSSQLRSPLVLNDIARFESGQHLPLNFIYDYA